MSPRMSLVWEHCGSFARLNRTIRASEGDTHATHSGHHRGTSRCVGDDGPGVGVRRAR